MSSVPVEKCELEPYEVCSTVMKQYPTLVEKENCEIVPRESCDPERVLPKIVVRPVVKKSCVKAESPVEITESPVEIITEPIQQEKISTYFNHTVQFFDQKLLAPFRNFVAKIVKEVS